MLAKIERTSFATVIAIAVLLSGCGGGGGGGGSGGDTAPPPPMMPDNNIPTGGPSDTNQTRVQALDDPMVIANLVDAISRAVDAKPNPGSVTQSSNVDSNNNTTDQIEITAEYGSAGPRFSVRNGTAWSIGMSEGNPRFIADTTSPWRGAELGKRISGGTLYVDAYTDIQAPETQQTGGSSDDGTRNVPQGTMILGSGITISAGRDITGQNGTYNGEQGTFNCDGSGTSGCAVTSGIITRGMWTFTPDRPPGAVDVSGSDSVAWTGSFDSNHLPGTRNGVQGYFRCLSSTCGHRTSNGRQMLTGSWVFISDTGTTISVPDADYLAGGIWMIVPDGASSAADYVFGAFTDGNDPFVQDNLTVITGTATYDGDATGVYSEEENGSTVIGYFDGYVELEADFGTVSSTGTISGSITNFIVDGDPQDGRLDLGAAEIGSANSGFFQGAVSGSDTGRVYEGQWGGQFYGNGEADGKPGSVAGTFGGGSMDNAVNFVGFFGAHKQ